MRKIWVLSGCFQSKVDRSVSPELTLFIMVHGAEQALLVYSCESRHSFFSTDYEESLSCWEHSFGCTAVSENLGETDCLAAAGVARGKGARKYHFQYLSDSSDPLVPL